MSGTSTNSSISCSSAKSRRARPRVFESSATAITHLVGLQRDLHSPQPVLPQLTRLHRLLGRPLPLRGCRRPEVGKPSGQIHSSRVDAPHDGGSRIRRPAVCDELPHDVVTAAEAHHDDNRDARRSHGASALFSPSPVCPVRTRKPDAMLRCVTGNSRGLRCRHRGGHARHDLDGNPGSRQHEHLFRSLPNTKGSPPFRRTTRLP